MLRISPHIGSRLDHSSNRWPAPGRSQTQVCGRINADGVMTASATRAAVAASRQPIFKAATGLRPVGRVNFSKGKSHEPASQTPVASRPAPIRLVSMGKRLGQEKPIGERAARCMPKVAASPAVRRSIAPRLIG